MRETFNVDIRVTSPTGEVENLTRRVAASRASTNAATFANVLGEFYRNIGSHITYVYTRGLEVVRVTTVGGAFEDVPAAQFDTAAGTAVPYRVILKAKLDNGSNQDTPFNINATSAADAKMRVWNSLKDGGLGRKFCDMAAGLSELTVVVQRQTAAAVIFDAAAGGIVTPATVAATERPADAPEESIERPSDRPGFRLFVVPCFACGASEERWTCSSARKKYIAATAATGRGDLSETATTINGFRLSVDPDRRLGRIVPAEGDVIEVGGTVAWERYRSAAIGTSDRRIYDWLTNYLSNGRD